MRLSCIFGGIWRHNMEKAKRNLAISAGQCLAEITEFPFPDLPWYITKFHQIYNSIG